MSGVKGHDDRRNQASRGSARADARAPQTDPSSRTRLRPTPADRGEPRRAVGAEAGVGWMGARELSHSLARSQSQSHTHKV